MSLCILPLDPNYHDRTNFDCGNPQLNRYLQQQANQDNQKNIATTFVLVQAPNPSILGYYSLSAYTIELAELSPGMAKKLPRYPLLPATLIGRLAIDQPQQGQGYGALLLIDALRKAKAVTSQIASVAVIVDAIDEAAGLFYQKYGFQSFQSNPMKLYLPMKDIDVL